jgi:hypothetical protein
MTSTSALPRAAAIGAGTIGAGPARAARGQGAIAIGAPTTTDELDVLLLLDEKDDELDEDDLLCKSPQDVLSRFGFFWALFLKLVNKGLARKWKPYDHWQNYAFKHNI